MLGGGGGGGGVETLAGGGGGGVEEISGRVEEGVDLGGVEEGVDLGGVEEGVDLAAELAPVVTFRPVEDAVKPVGETWLEVNAPVAETEVPGPVPDVALGELDAPQGTIEPPGPRTGLQIPSSPESSSKSS